MLNLKMLLFKLVPRRIKRMRMLLRSIDTLGPRVCPICGYEGKFFFFGTPVRQDAQCARCDSLERHRLFWLWFKQNKHFLPGPLIHFAPERCLELRLRSTVSEYQTADLYQRADLTLNIEQMDLGSGTVGSVICNHVFEHVDDRRALDETFRVLQSGGLLICSVPLVEGWEATYEDTGISGAKDRELHFGQSDHLRRYGRDFKDRLLGAGFGSVEEFTVHGADAVKYALWPGEKIFVCRKT